MLAGQTGVEKLHVLTLFTTWLNVQQCLGDVCSSNMREEPMKVIYMLWNLWFARNKLLWRVSNGFWIIFAVEHLWS